LDLCELDLALELAAQLCGRAAGAAHPLAELRGDFGQPLRAQHEQRNYEHENELRQTGVEHGAFRSD
jgi:hypothetical protein